MKNWVNFIRQQSWDLCRLGFLCKADFHGETGTTRPGRPLRRSTGLVIRSISDLSGPNWPVTFSKHVWPSELSLQNRRFPCCQAVSHSQDFLSFIWEKKYQPDTGNTVKKYDWDETAWFKPMLQLFIYFNPTRKMLPWNILNGKFLGQGWQNR